MKRIQHIRPHIMVPDMTVRDAMMRINEMEPAQQFQIVVNNDSRLLGTITDGDIRRAILLGVGLDESVTRCMHANPVKGAIGNDFENEKKLREIDAHISFLPILDEKRVPKEILVLANGAQTEVRALVMAGGFGTRLGERTKSTPKPLLQVQGKPILDHILHRLEAVGVNDIVISVHYLAEKIEKYVERRANKASVHFLPEASPLGTAGAIGGISKDMEHPLIVLNGDVLTSLDFKAFIEFHTSQSFDATVAVAQHQIEIPFGVVRHGKDGIFLGVDEKPRISNFVAAGIYMLSPKFRALVKEGERLDMPELLERGRAAELTTGLFPIHEYWTDIGRPHDLDAAENERAAKP